MTLSVPHPDAGYCLDRTSLFQHNGLDLQSPKHIRPSKKDVTRLFWRKCMMVLRTVLSALSFSLLGLIAGPTAGLAGTNVNININAPLPPLMVPAPPPLVPIPGTYAYFAPDVDVEIVFYRGAWYRTHEGHWYRAAEYNGSWRPVPHDRVPHVLINLPRGYRHMPPGQDRIPYGQVKKNWRTWERDRHWDKHEKRQHGEDGEYGGSGRDHGRGHDRRKHGDD
jgi:hypothetical protein